MKVQTEFSKLKLKFLVLEKKNIGTDKRYGFLFGNF